MATGKQGFRWTGGDPYSYEEISGTTSSAVGLDSLDSGKFKISVLAANGATPSTAAQFRIDPSVNGNVTTAPNGTGATVVNNGDLTVLAGNVNIPNTAVTGLQGIVNQGGNRLISNNGGDNIFVGSLSGVINVAGATHNTAFGNNALQNITGAGSSNVAVGNNALMAETTGIQNVAVGYTALASSTTGSNNVAIGSGALTATVTGASNIAIGTGALNFLSAGASGNTAVGNIALFSAATGQYNTVIGNYSGTNFTTTDGNNVCINHRGVAGSNSKWFMAFGDAVGNGTLFSHNFGLRNTFSGASSGNLTLTASDSTGIGYNTLNALTNGAGSTAVGANALALHQGPGGNDAFGSGALGSCVSGGSNVALGHQALTTLTTGNFNVAVGLSAGLAVTTGTNNTIVGYIAGNALTTGSFNIIIGQDAGIGYTGAESSNILIAHAGSLGESNTMRIGSGTGSGQYQNNRTFITGIRGITTAMNDAIPVIIDSQGQLGTVSSSERYKENIRPMGNESEIIYDLEPKLFNFKEDPTNYEMWGLIAEEVDKTFPRLVIYDEENKPETVRYHELPILMLNEMKKLRERLNILESKLSSCCCNQKESL